MNVIEGVEILLRGRVRGVEEFYFDSFFDANLTHFIAEAAIADRIIYKSNFIILYDYCH